MSFRLKPEYHRNIYITGLVLIAIGLPFSKSLLSFAQGLLLINWLWEGSLRSKIKAFGYNKPALILSSLPLLYIIGIFYSQDFDYAYNDIRIKLPLIILPLIISTSHRITEKDFLLLMNFFSLAVLISSFISLAAYFGYTNKPVNNLRDISVFMSHIRFSLLICIAVLYLFYAAIYQLRNPLKYAQLAGGLWLIFFLFFLESATGLVILSAAAIIVFLNFSLRLKSPGVKLFYSGSVLIIPLLFSAYLYKEIKNFYFIKPVDFSSLDEFSPYGEKYLHDTTKLNFENGNLVWIYYAESELEREWNSRSSIKFNQKDQRGQNISQTIMRFLTSKNLRKDASGVLSLTDDEIKAIERGDANVLYLEKGIQKRIHQTIWEFNNYFMGENPQGNSITQRLEFWKASLMAIRQNLFLGAGTGELQHEMNRQYAALKTLLEPKYWLKPHNQFFTITVALGIFGLSWFLVFLFAPATLQKSWGDYFYLSFFTVAVLSMFTEDTLDTQAGISFFTFFSCLFLFREQSSSSL